MSLISLTYIFKGSLHLEGKPLQIIFPFLEQVFITSWQELVSEQLQRETEIEKKPSEKTDFCLNIECLASASLLTQKMNTIDFPHKYKRSSSVIHQLELGQ